MVKLTIDNKTIEAAPGKRLIEVARENGINIPSLCYNRNLHHYTSCMVCMVREVKTGNFIPSCSVFVGEGMVIDASGSEVRKLRKEALGMLLTEHRAECEAPCSLVCPLGLNIPLLNRYLAKGNTDMAADLAFSEMGLPSIACSVCPGYCENACRRKMIDHSIGIPALVQFSTGNIHPGDFRSREISGKRVAIVGGGSSGLISAFNLLVDGHNVEIFEKEEFAGGSLIEEFKRLNLPARDAVAEIARLIESGVNINYGVNVDDEFISNRLTGKYDAIIIACTPVPAIVQKASTADKLRFGGDIRIIDGYYLFLTGSAAKENQPLIRRMGQAKLAALSISRFMVDGKIVTEGKKFNSTLGRIGDEEKIEWTRECPEKSERTAKPVDSKESAMEAENCLHCDCRASSDCRLRELCDSMEVKNPPVKFTGHPIAKKIDYQNSVIFEHAKCIKCGLCVRVTEFKTNDPSLCFTGRGFMTIISEPVSYGFGEITGKEIDKAIYICPTGALSWKE